MIASMMDLRMFDAASQTDGFFSQIDYASKILVGEYDSNALFFIHVIRLISILPFYFTDSQQFPSAINACIYLFYLSPLLIRRDKISVYIQLIFIFFPVFFSYRASIGMCAMGYLYIILFKNVKSYSLFFLSAVFANLSSGIVLSWVIVVFLSSKKILKIISILLRYLLLQLSVFLCRSYIKLNT
jgi:hypothetical protein